MSDTLEPEKLARIINNYLSEMTTIAIECGGTIDKFIGDAVMVFFGDPESIGEEEDALNCVEMALRMKSRVTELRQQWIKMGVKNGLNVRMGIATGFCTVGNFGSNQRLDYTALGSPVNLSARLHLVRFKCWYRNICLINSSRNGICFACRFASCLWFV